MNNAETSKNKGAEAPVAARNPGRRRLLRGGIGATPILMTLASRSVLAGTQCTSPSGFVSMPASRHGTPQTCIGRTPGYWKQDQHFNQWPNPYFPVATKVGNTTKPATTFNSVFGLPSPYNNADTFLDVLKTEDQGYSGPPHDVARHVVAELLNIQKGWVTVLTVAKLKNIWHEYMATGGGAGGYFTPTAGVKWYHDDIVNYLKSTMI